MAARIKEKQEVKVGKVDVAELRKSLNSKLKGAVFDLKKENPTDVKEWISTGSTWLDAIVAKGKMGGIPVGKIIELAGLQSTGKSYLAAQIAGNAQKQGITPVYFDAESALNSEFLEKAGCNVDDLIYIQPPDLETVFETIETLMGTSDQKYLFIIDSLAATPTRVDTEGTFNPNERIGVKAALLSKAFPKITTPLAQRECTLLILNQLKINIKATSEAPMNGKYLTDSQKYNTPGGSSPDYFTSLRIWLTKSFAKDSMVYDDKGYQIGSNVKARIEKSRFGTQNRVAEFKILWGDTVGVMNEESILEAIKGKTDHLESGVWNKLTYADGTVEKWQGLEEGFTKLMKTNDKFKQRVMEIFDYEVIQKFDKKIGNASDFLNDGAGEDVQR
jgi:recombination protein RecA